MGYIDAIILGIVEGLTEFLPVSSTGHLIITGELLGQQGTLSDTFEIVIQLGAMLAVVLCYFSRFWHLVFPKKGANKEGDKATLSGLRGIGLLVVTTLPGAVLGLCLHSSIKNLFTAQSVALALAVGAIFMMLVEKVKVEPKYNSVDDLDFKTALGVGVFQCCALWPGFSRSASTIMGAMLLGVKKEVAAEYSFLAAVPIILGAALLDLWKSFDLLTFEILPYFLTGTFVAFISALIAIKSFIKLLSKVGLVPFAWYRLLLAIPVYYFMVN